MRRVFAVAAMFALMLPAVAAAQEHHDEHKGPPPKSGPPHPPPPPGQPHPQFKQAHPPGPANPQFKPVHPLGPPGPAGQFSWHGHQFNRFHPAHPFIYPPGWAYRRWAIGGILPPLFLVPDYYFMDWAALGLPPPPPGTQYLRYGPDLLLVDVPSGQIVEVIPDVFY